MKKGCRYLLLILFTLPNCYAQKLVRLDSTRTCSFQCGNVNSSTYTFDPSNSAKKVITDISSTVGLNPTFQIRAADIDGIAEATIISGEKFIFYNQYLMSSIDLQAKNNWSNTFIIAHEMGHLLLSHNLDSLEVRPQYELDADKFAGFVMNKLGATLEETVGAFNTTSDDGCDTHPPKRARIQAATVGWTGADDEKKKFSNNSLSEKMPISGQPSAEDCLKTTGDYCFTNSLKKTVTIKMSTNGYFDYLAYCGPPSCNEMILEPGQSQCFYGLAVGKYYYVVYRAIPPNERTIYNNYEYDYNAYAKGMILIEKCTSKTFTVK